MTVHQVNEFALARVVCALLRRFYLEEPLGLGKCRSWSASSYINLTLYQAGLCLRFCGKEGNSEDDSLSCGMF